MERQISGQLIYMGYNFFYATLIGCFREMQCIGMNALSLAIWKCSVRRTSLAKGKNCEIGPHRACVSEITELKDKEEGKGAGFVCTWGLWCQ